MRNRLRLKSWIC